MKKMLNASKELWDRNRECRRGRKAQSGCMGPSVDRRRGVACSCRSCWKTHLQREAEVNLWRVFNAKFKTLELSTGNRSHVRF